jgi:protein-tyrosine-phosphatase
VTGDRLAAPVLSEDRSPEKLPIVLFLCTHNAGRSQMALGWLAHLGRGRVTGWSGGSEPETELNTVAVAAMAEAGIDISSGSPKRWTIEQLEAADVVITMGCGETCPVIPGKPYEDWDVADPAGQPLEVIRTIRDDI